MKTEAKPHVSDDDIAKEVLRLQERDGVCAPEVLVEEAADPAHPLHTLFDWDDTTAATSWRVHRARQIIGRVRIIVKGERAPAHLNVTISTDSGTRQGYVPFEVAMSDPDMRRQVIRDARVLLKGCKRRLTVIEAGAAVEHLNKAIDALPDEEVDIA